MISEIIEEVFGDILCKIIMDTAMEAGSTGNEEEKTENLVFPHIENLDIKL